MSYFKNILHKFEKIKNAHVGLIVKLQKKKNHLKIFQNNSKFLEIELSKFEPFCYCIVVYISIIISLLMRSNNSQKIKHNQFVQIICVQII